jgi:hypothetical protein
MPISGLKEHSQEWTDTCLDIGHKKIQAFKRANPRLVSADHGSD